MLEFSYLDQQEITLKDYEDFFKVLCSIHDIDTALKFYAIAGASIDKSNNLLYYVLKIIEKRNRI